MVRGLPGGATGPTLTRQGYDVIFGGIPTVSALVLIECDKGAVKATAETIADLPGVTEVYSVAGRVDLVAVIRVPDNERLAEIVTSAMLGIPGISRTETLIAFQVFSRHDLERMFSIGLDEE